MMPSICSHKLFPRARGAKDHIEIGNSSRLRARVAGCTMG